MKNMLIIEKQIHHQKQKQEEQLHLPPLTSPLTLRPPEQQQKLMLEDISPIWASRLKKENLPAFMSPKWWKWHYELQKASKCVVGEAYGYSSQYTDECGRCNRFGYKFLYYFMLNWRGKSESNKQDFVKHWNEKHNQSIYPF
jgi:hypothetical protein